MIKIGQYFPLQHIPNIKVLETPDVFFTVYIGEYVKYFEEIQRASLFNISDQPINLWGSLVKFSEHTSLVIFYRDING